MRASYTLHLSLSRAISACWSFVYKHTQPNATTTTTTMCVCVLCICVCVSSVYSERLDVGSGACATGWNHVRQLGARASRHFTRPPLDSHPHTPAMVAVEMYMYVYVFRSSTVYTWCRRRPGEVFYMLWHTICCCDDDHAGAAGAGEFIRCSCIDWFTHNCALQYNACVIEYINI